MRLGLDGIEVTITDEPFSLEGTHLCPFCGSTSHGQPVVEHGFVSIAHRAELTAVATSDATPIGIDIESIARIARHPVADALLHASEAAELVSLDPVVRDRRLAELWTAKEAILKATGRGLTVDPRLLALRGTADEIELVEWPSGIGITTTPVIRTFMIDDDILGTVVTLAARITDPKAP
jgi:4'-phosphopantetheinyl transferase